MTFFGGYSSSYSKQISEFGYSSDEFYLKGVAKLPQKFRYGSCYEEPVSKTIFLCFDNYAKDDCMIYSDGSIVSGPKSESYHLYSKMVEFGNGLIVVGGDSNKMVETFYRTGSL